MWIFFRGRVKKILCPHNTDCMLLRSTLSLAIMCTCHSIILLTFPFSEPTSVNILYRTTKIIEIIFQKRHWREKSFKKSHFAHIGNEIKICSPKKKKKKKKKAIITFPTFVKIHLVCFTVTGSFLITIHLFGSLNFPG